MKKLLTKSYDLLPPKSREKLYVFFFYSLVNTVLDFISIAYLAPVILLFIDRKKLNAAVEENFNITLSNNMIGGLLVSLIAFFILKNIIQTRLVRHQLQYVYNIASSISEKLMHKFTYETYTNHNATKKNVFFRDVFQLPLVFATNVLFSVYTIFSELIILLILLAIGFAYAPMFTFFSFALLFVFALLLVYFQKKKTDAYNSSITHLYQDNIKNIMNIFYGFLDIKASRSEAQFKQRFANSNAAHNAQLASLQAFKQSNSRYFELLFVIGLLFIMVFYLFFSSGFNDLIVLSFFIGSSIKIIPSFNKILSSFIDIKANQYSVDLLHGYAETIQPENDAADFQSTFALRDISFKHAKKDILHNVDFDIKKGDFISISGNSGEGKSTFLHIISGFLAPESGTLIIDGKPIKSNETKFGFVGYVSQQPFIFQGSILENITMLKNETADLNHIDEIVTALDLKSWIDTQPNGIDSELFLESKKLSGGQKQRIALARTLYLKPKILLLDEATNQVDEQLETRIFEYLKKQTQASKITVIAVSHNTTVNAFSDKQYELSKQKLTHTHG